MDYHDQQAEVWAEALRAAGHTAKLDENGNIDFLDLGDIHDGPQCSACYAVWCRNCADPSKIKPCAKTITARATSIGEQA